MRRTKAQKAKVKLKSLQVIHWSESVMVQFDNPETGQKEERQEMRHPIILCGLGDDGNAWVSSQVGVWRCYPISDETVNRTEN